MIVRTLLAALVAGLIAGAFVTAAQQYRVVPLILHAEQFENGGVGAAEHEHGALTKGGFIENFVQALSPVRPALAHEPAEEQSLFGMDRFTGTLSANLVTGAGFALLLVAISLFTGHPITVANGVVWGSLGWLAVHFLPAIGLPPELPGSPAADLHDRQLWWAVTVLFSAIGLGLLVLRGEVWAKIAGVGIITLPHLFGAPYPADISSEVPALLAAEFAVAALATALMFWVVLGLSVGYLTERFGRAA